MVAGNDYLCLMKRWLSSDAGTKRRYDLRVTMVTSIIVIDVFLSGVYTPGDVVLFHVLLSKPFFLHDHVDHAYTFKTFFVWSL